MKNNMRVIGKKTIALLDMVSVDILADLSLTNHEIADKLSFMGIVIKDAELREWFVIKSIPRWDQTHRGKRRIQDRKLIDCDSALRHRSESYMQYGHEHRNGFKR